MNNQNPIQNLSKTTYPFGMYMPGRSFSSGSYRYGFNGMEKDDEVKGNGKSYTSYFRQYDPRLGRWNSVDPITASTPSWSPYRFGFNNPTLFIDPSGNIETKYVDENNKELLNTDDGSNEVITVKNKDVSIFLAAVYLTTKDKQNEEEWNNRWKKWLQRNIEIPTVKFSWENTEEKLFYDNKEFWDIEPTYTEVGVSDEWEKRLNEMWFEIGQEVGEELILKNMGIPQFFDANKFAKRKIIFHAIARLRTAGPNSILIIKSKDQVGNPGYISIHYYRDPRGIEKFDINEVTYRNEDLFESFEINQ
jgi:RHS repeat-associated protein